MGPWAKENNRGGKPSLKLFDSAWVLRIPLQEGRDLTLIEAISKARPPYSATESQQRSEWELDQNSYHVAALQGSEIVGAVRLVDNLRDAKVLREHSRYGVGALNSVIMAAGVVEVSRAWVSFKAASMSIFPALIRRSVEYALRTDARFLALSSAKEMAPLYDRLGCAPVSTFYLDDAIWTLFLFDTARIGPAAPRRHEERR